jgi:Tfp pilus assembly protein PilF
VLLVLGALTRQKRWKEAFALCEKAWTEGKCSPEAIGAVSVGLMAVMQFSDAQVATLERHLNAAWEKNKKSVVLLMHLADLYDKRGRYDQAVQMYRKVLEVEPKNVVALNNMAWLLAVRDVNAEKALDYINEAIKGMGQRGDLLDTRATVYLALNKPDKALADIEDAVADDPTPARLFHKALAHDRNKEPTQARETLRRAKEKGLKVALLHPAEAEQARKLLEAYGEGLN